MTEKSRRHLKDENRSVKSKAVWYIDNPELPSNISDGLLESIVVCNKLIDQNDPSFKKM